MKSIQLLDEKSTKHSQLVGGHRSDLDSLVQNKSE